MDYSYSSIRQTRSDNWGFEFWEVKITFDGGKLSESEWNFGSWKLITLSDVWNKRSVKYASLIPLHSSHLLLTPYLPDGFSLTCLQTLHTNALAVSLKQILSKKVDIHKNRCLDLQPDRDFLRVLRASNIPASLISSSECSEYFVGVCF